MEDSKKNQDHESCTVCGHLDLRASFYPPPNEGNAIEMPRHYHRTGCPFDKLLIDTLSLSPKFAATGAPTKLWRVDLGTVVWAPTSDKDFTETIVQDLSAPGWYRSGDSFQRDAKYYNIYELDNPRGLVNLHPAYDQTLGNRNNLFSCRKINKEADLLLVSTWMRACNILHGPKCPRMTWDRMANSGMRLIDITNQCLISVTENVEYFALSYCWGNPDAVKKSVRLTKATVSELFGKNSLSKDRDDLPTTIRDAMTVTQKLGRRYLWVDALCICQDDDKDKAAQINQMDKIYKFAELTIVGAAGDNTWSGLPGIGDQERVVSQFERRIGDVNFMSREIGLFAKALVSCAWNKRAWTFQEQYFSSRILIFGENEMTWHCECDAWTEGMMLEYFEPDTTVEFDSQHKNWLKPPSNFTPIQKLNYVIAKGSDRELTFQEDRLRCMQGFFNALSEHFPGGFFWGTPVSIFDSWLPFHSALFGEAPWDRREGFPSWSWAGWKECIASSVVSPYDNDVEGWWSDVYLSADISPRDTSWIQKEVAWHRIDAAESGWEPISSTMIIDEGSIFYQESLAKWRSSDSSEMLRQTKIRFNNAGVPLAHAIGFWTQSVHLPVDKRLATSEECVDHFAERHHGPGYNVRDLSGRIIGYMYFLEEYRDAQPDELYFILVAQNLRWQSKFGPLLEILHVEKRGDITYRVQGVRNCVLDLNIWKTLDKKWEFFTMA